jgi:hypothetical protein
MYRAKDFDDASLKAERLVADGGYGHTSSLYINTDETEKMDKFEEAMKTCRILINTPSSQGGIGDLYNFKMPPSLTLGCGSWGGNSVSENVGPKHLLNLKTVAERRENMLWFRTPEKVYFKRGCMPVALDELGSVMGKKRCFIVTDQFLYKSGFSKRIEDKLDEMGIVHSCFWDVAPDPTLQCARRGEEQMRAFEPDCIIALGGGSAMDCGKIMWMMYEHPECKFEDMSMDFMDIRKRVYTFPKMGEKAYFVAIPTSSGTGSEVTPFAIITDADTGIKWPITDYELMPEMAIVDVDNMMTQPKGLTSASGVDVLTHAMEAYVSIMALRLHRRRGPEGHEAGLREPSLGLRQRCLRPQGPRGHGQRQLHGRHGLRQRVPRPQPLAGPQARRLPSHPARHRQRHHPHQGHALQRGRAPHQDGHLPAVRLSPREGPLRRGRPLLRRDRQGRRRGVREVPRQDRRAERARRRAQDHQGLRHRREGLPRHAGRR